MATDTLPANLDDRDEPLAPGATGSALGASGSASALFNPSILAFLKPLASLKLTVTLFALAIFLIFAGTLAQARHDISWVLHNYFRSPLVWIEIQTFFPPAWFSDSPTLMNLPGSFPFPGGFTIGALMAVNLLAAHGLRFKIQSTGNRLAAGLGIIAFGCLVTGLVIAAGPDKDGSQATSPIDWITLWKLFLVGLACACVAIAGALFQLDSSRKVTRAVLAGVGCALLALLGFLLFHIDPQFLNPSAMRILWQLLKAEAAAVVLLAGCMLVFRKRAGIVLLHAGIGLIMANELVVHFKHKEEQMLIAQGQSANYAIDIRATELAIIDAKSSSAKDDVSVIPESLLKQSLDSGQPISDSQLPLNVRLVKFYENSALVKDQGDKESLATAGAGRNWPIVEVPTVTGAGAGDELNQPSAYVEFLDKITNKSLGTYLLTSILTTTQKIEFNDKEYEIALRFEHDYKPYTMHLHEVRGDLYLGSSTPRNYSSDLQLVDPTHQVDRRVGIRMNEPLRYDGETFYQSEFHPGDPATGQPPRTTLQVVSNFGWMIPYIACMIVITGLAYQFGQSLIRFLRRRDASPPLSHKATTVGRADHEVASSHLPPLATALPIVVVALAVVLLGYTAMTPSTPPSEMNLYNCGELPVVTGGRVEPIDTLARNTLRLLSNKESYLDFSGLTVKHDGEALLVTEVLADSPAQAAGIKPKDHIVEINGHKIGDTAFIDPIEKLDDPNGGKIELSIVTPDQTPRSVIVRRQYQPAIKWLLEVIAHPESANKQRVFRIDNLDVLHMLGLQRREYYRYSYDEIHKNQDDLDRAHDEFGKRSAASYSVYDKKLNELFSRLHLYDVLRGAFWLNPLPEFPTPEDMKADPEATKQRVEQIALQRDRLVSFLRLLMASHPPLAIPFIDQPAEGDATGQETYSWEPYTLGWLDNYSARVLKQPLNPAVVAWETIFEAYGRRDAAAFNQAVAGYSAALATKPPPQLAEANTSFEAWYMHWSPFAYCTYLYLIAGCFALLAWLGWSAPLNRTAFWLILVTFCVHTFALWARMHISGRPPVTNLYSTAIFIGWGAVLAGLILESIFRLGFGSIVAGFAGFATLLISDKLTLLLEPSSGGDTIGVMQAVLDTQFWLATHVTVVNLGYMATYVSGLLGIIYVIGRLASPNFAGDLGKSVARMIYGTVCFALLFSFLGTVLGGLWADDSWGRFWGWDPKENGALMIVLWNALVLHARWDGMVKDRGLAVLAIGGNIITSWSYFGVNQLGVGLHSYGFTEGVLFVLAIFCATQLALIAVGLLPPRVSRHA